MVILKKIVIPGEGLQFFSRWIQLFPGWGIQLLIPTETYRTCDFPGGGRDSPSPTTSGSAHAGL